MQHEDMVKAFFERCREDDPDLYDNVCKKHPTLSEYRLQQIEKTEIPNGLLGLEDADLPLEIAMRHNLQARVDD